jgi:uncharacterized protein with PIN domain
MKFIVDHNVGKLARWLRMMGYDSVFFTGEDDGRMVKQALAEDRILLTRDTGIMRRRMVTGGSVHAVLLESEEPEQQIQQLVVTLDLTNQANPFTICMECNEQLTESNTENIRERVPPHVFKTQTQYMECPACHRVYWHGTHWQAMLNSLEKMYNNQDTRAKFQINSNTQ